MSLAPGGDVAAPTPRIGQTGPDSPLRQIVQTVCDVRAIAITDVLSGDRRHAIARARHEAFDALIVSGYASPRIARFFDVDVSTVLQGSRTHRKRVADGLLMRRRSSPGAVTDPR